MTRMERAKLRRRMQRRIWMVVEQRRMALNLPPLEPLESEREALDPDVDPDATAEISPAPSANRTFRA